METTCTSSKYSAMKQLSTLHVAFQGIKLKWKDLEDILGGERENSENHVLEVNFALHSIPPFADFQILLDARQVDP